MISSLNLLIEFYKNFLPDLRIQGRSCRILIDGDFKILMTADQHKKACSCAAVSFEKAYYLFAAKLCFEFGQPRPFQCIKKKRFGHIGHQVSEFIDIYDPCLDVMGGLRGEIFWVKDKFRYRRGHLHGIDTA